MSDREMLKLAAKAAGYQWRGFSASGEPLLEEDARKPEPRLRCPVVWNPLTDDGDALRLAVKIDVVVAMYGAHVRIFTPYSETLALEAKGQDPESATRRAIVRAAAEIGRRMQEGGAA